LKSIVAAGIRTGVASAVTLQAGACATVATIIEPGTSAQIGVIVYPLFTVDGSRVRMLVSNYCAVS
jgi:hypothetical protein